MRAIRWLYVRLVLFSLSFFDVILFHSNCARALAQYHHTTKTTAHPISKTAEPRVLDDAF